jgi:hypothetical protein
MTGSRLDILRELPPLMPAFLRRRRAGLPALPALVKELGLDRDAFGVLWQMDKAHAAYHRRPVTLAELRADDPYSTVDHFSEHLAELQALGLVLAVGEARLTPSPVALDAFRRLHAAGREHVARMEPLPPDSLEQLAVHLEAAVDSLRDNPALAPRPGNHLTAAVALAVPREGAPAMVRIEQAISSLWAARDDAHTRAWRLAGMDGPPVAALTAVWGGEASTTRELEAALAGRQDPEGVESSLSDLAGRGYVSRHGDALEITPAGALAREDIERETDRIYFVTWPHTAAEAAEMRDLLRALIDNLPAPPAPPPPSPPK